MKKYSGPKYIVVVGGVISGVGKGMATASIAKIFTNFGYRTTAIKIDPYISYDAGLFRPSEHGEVWVTEDGGEIDQDLGTYERFLNVNISKTNNITTGQIYKEVIERERRGEYLGATVEFIPHITDEIKRRIISAGKGNEIVIVEIGGTMGEYQNIPFLFAMKSLEQEIGKSNMVYVLITFLPVPSHIQEMKTKPTQQAIKLLSENGIFPDFILCRARQRLDHIRKKKIETYANIPIENVISAPDTNNVYSIPLNFERDRLGDKILEVLCLKKKKKPDWQSWKYLVNQIEHPKRQVTVGIVNKYVVTGSFRLADCFLSVNRAIIHASAAYGVKTDIRWIDAENLEGKTEEEFSNVLQECDGFIVPGAFGTMGVEGMIRVIRFAREQGIPYLGLCFGLQMAVIEYARNVLGLSNAHTTEVNPETEHPVIDILESQKKIIEEMRLGGTMRLGAYAAILRKDSLVYTIYKRRERLKVDMEEVRRMRKNPELKYRLGKLREGQIWVLERHRHRYEVSPHYVKDIEKKGLVFSGYHMRHDGTRLMEFIELRNHPFFIATQAHPEFKSRLENPAPLFHGFIGSTINQAKKKK